MHSLISASFSRVRTALLVLVLIFIAGGYSYVTIPKEAAPEIDIPIFIVNVSYTGISAEDSARLLVEPLERRFQTLQGVRRMNAQAGDGFATVTLEFQPGYDQQQALQSVRDETSNAEADLPGGADPPTVREIDVSIFPILTVALSGHVPERELIAIARSLQERLEAITGVLQADMSGDRDDLLEIIVDPLAMQSYGISTGQIMQAVQNNNQLVAAGAFDTGEGRLGVTIPGTIQSIADVLAMPVQVSGTTVVRVQDVAEVRQTFRDPASFARIDGQPSIGLDVRKVAGANVIETVAEVRAVVDEMQRDWSSAIRVDFTQDQADDIQTLLSDLENSVIAAVLLFQLYNVLGKKVGRQPEDNPKPVPLPAAPAGAPEAARGPVVDPGLTAAIAGLKTRDPNFDPHRFLEGARQAYETIVRAYAKGDRDALRPLPSLCGGKSRSRGHAALSFPSSPCYQPPPS